MKTNRRNFIKAAFAAISSALLSACDIVRVKKEPAEEEPRCPLDLHVSYGQCETLEEKLPSGFLVEIYQENGPVETYFANEEGEMVPADPFLYDVYGNKYLQFEELGLHRSKDNGLTWEKVQDDDPLVPDCLVPYDPSPFIHWSVEDGYAFRSKDSALPIALPKKTIRKLDWYVSDDDRLYITSDWGMTWIEIETVEFT